MDAGKAKIFDDTKDIPYLVDPATGTERLIPEMDKVGEVASRSFQKLADLNLGRVCGWLVSY